MWDGARTLGVRLRKAFARKNQFRGAEIVLARKFSAIGWVLGVVAASALLPFYPPTIAIGGAGWIVVAALSSLIGTWLFFLFRHRERVTYNVLIAGAYTSVALVGIYQWLAGGLPAPYHELYPLIICSAFVHPPRRFFPWIVVAGGVMIAPELDASTAQLGDLITEFVLYVGVSVFLVVLMFRIRDQRHELVTGEARARELARVDALTELGNRRAFEEVLNSEIARARRSGTPLSLLVCDLDGFKKINDGYGHLVGDDCLRQAAHAIRNELRASDSCFRWGGDEFVVLLADTDEAAAADVTRRLEAVVARASARPGGLPLGITSGQALLLDDMAPEELIARADLALLARKDGRSAGPAVLADVAPG